MNSNGVLTKVVMEFLQDDGSIKRRTLNATQAQKWDDLIAGVCMFAHIHQANPDWTVLDWKEEIIPAPKKKKGDK